MIFKNAAVFYNAHKTHTAPLAQEVCASLRAHGVHTDLITQLDGLTAETDLLVSMGGDGTMLYCARAAAPLGIPIFGINCGTLGFLAACEKEDALPTLQALLNGKCAVNERFMLHTRILAKGAKPREFLAFNDCVLRAAAPRAFLLEAKWNEKEMPSYFGDGVIVATPTGSTAYSLASGGPIVEPGVDVLAVTPICPHTLNQRPLILSAQGTLSLTPSFKNKADRALCSLDGQINLTLPAGACVQITRSALKAKLLCPPERGFFQILNRKLKWGNR